MANATIVKKRPAADGGRVAAARGQSERRAVRVGQDIAPFNLRAAGNQLATVVIAALRAFQSGKVTREPKPWERGPNDGSGPPGRRMERHGEEGSFVEDAAVVLPGVSEAPLEVPPLPKWSHVEAA